MAYTYLCSEGIYAVVINEHHFQSMREYFNDNDFRNVMLFILGHELTHVSHMDIVLSEDVMLRPGISKLVPHLIKVIALIAFALWSIIYVIRMGGTAMPYIMAFTLLSFITTFAIMIIVPLLSKRYWEQIQELRADRKSIKISKLDPQVFLLFTEYCEKNYVSGCDDEHVADTLRYRELKNHHFWSAFDYIRYSLKFSVNYILGKKSIW